MSRRVRYVIEMDEEDADALGVSAFSAASEVHALVRRGVRNRGGRGTTAVEYIDLDGSRMCERADPPGLLAGPYRLPD